MSRGVRVLYVIDSVGSGGAEHSLRALVPPLVGAGHELVVVTLGPTDVLADPLREAGAEVVLPERSLSWTGAVAHVRAEIGRRHPDLVHTTLFRERRGRPGGGAVDPHPGGVQPGQLVLRARAPRRPGPAPVTGAGRPGPRRRHRGRGAADSTR